jgi:hypothetical protein
MTSNFLSFSSSADGSFACPHPLSRIDRSQLILRSGYAVDNCCKVDEEIVEPEDLFAARVPPADHKVKSLILHSHDPVEMNAQN